MTKFLVKDVHLETIIDTLSWYMTWQLSGSNLIRAKQKLLRRRKGVYKSCWSRRGNQKSFIVSIPWNFARLVKKYLGIIIRQRHTDRKQMGLLKEQYAGVKEGTSAVLLQSGQRMVGGFHGMLLLSAKHSRSLVRWEDTF